MKQKMLALRELMNNIVYNSRGDVEASPLGRDAAFACLMYNHLTYEERMLVEEICGNQYDFNRAFMMCSTVKLFDTMVYLQNLN